MELMVVVNCIDLNGLHCHFYLVDYVGLMPLKNSISVFMNLACAISDLLIAWQHNFLSLPQASQASKTFY